MAATAVRWPPDVPRPSRAPASEHDDRPARRLPYQSRESVLLGGVAAGLQLAEAWRGAYRQTWRIAVLWAALYRRERDQAREDAAAAQHHAGLALGALEAAADRLVLAERRLKLARAALPALAEAVATGRRVDVAGALEELARALAG